MYVILVNNRFLTYTGKTSDEFPNARQFDSYESAVACGEKWLDKGCSVSIVTDYGSADETCEDL